MKLSRKQYKYAVSLVHELIARYRVQIHDVNITKKIVENIEKSENVTEFSEFLFSLIGKRLTANNIANDIFKKLEEKENAEKEEEINYDSIDFDDNGMTSAPKSRSEAKKMRRKKKLKKFILFVSGLKPEQNQIDVLYKEFEQYGDISCIYTEKEEGYALIQFVDLNGIFNAATCGKTHFDNHNIKVGYATDVECELERLSNSWAYRKITNDKINEINDFVEEILKEEAKAEEKN